MNPTGKGGFKDNPQNINPDGRPKKEQSLTEAILQKVSKEELAAIIVKLLKQADPTTIRFVYNHIDGMPVQKQILAGDEEQPVRLIIGGSDDRQDRSAEDETHAKGSGVDDADDTQD